MVLVDITTNEIQALDIVLKECKVNLTVAEILLIFRGKVVKSYKAELEKKVKENAKKIGKKD